MTKNVKILGLAIAAVALLVAAPAHATCGSSTTAATYNALTYSGISIIGPADVNVDPNAIVGRWWQMGNRGAANEGNAGNAANWFYFYGGDINQGTILNDMGTYDNVGCPATRMVHTIEAPSTSGLKAYFIAATVDEASGFPDNFPYYTQGSNLNMVAMPRPTVTSSTKAGTVVTLNVALSAPNGATGPGSATAVTGVELVTGKGTADPGRVYTTLAWPTTQFAAGTSGGSTVYNVDCSTLGAGEDHWMAARIVYDGGVKSDLVSEAVRVKCNSALADPGKFKLIDKQKKSR